MEVQPEFSASVGYREGFEIIVVRGELDEVTSPQVDCLLEQVQNGRTVIVDLTPLDFISSAGIHVLFRARTAPVAVVCPQSSVVARVLAIVRADRRVALFGSLDRAIQSLTLSQTA